MYVIYLMILRGAVSACCLIAACLTVPAWAAEGDKLRIGVITFLSGPAAQSAGVPARQGAQLMIDAINTGALPAPYQAAGAAGARIEAIFVDQAGGPTRQVTEYRNLVERRGVDLVMGYMTSADCNAIAPVAEELRTLTVFPICAVPIFEERDYRYVFQTINHATAHSVGLARFVAARYPEARRIAGINQNYAWGRDAWGAFWASLKVLRPDVEVVTALWPKLFAGQYGAEISALLTSRPDIVHSSMWGGDLQAFIVHAAPRGLFERSQVLFSVGAHVLPVVGDNLPDGTVISFEASHGVFMPKSEIAEWFRARYRAEYEAEVTEAETSYAEGILAIKLAFDKAAASAGEFPNTEQVIDAFEFLEWQGFSGTVKLALGKGHQAIQSTPVGYSKFDPAVGHSIVTDITYFGAECVNPPVGWKSQDWIEAGFPGAKCE